MTSLSTLRARTLNLIEQDIQVNNDLLVMAARIEDPRIKAAALERIEEGIERTRSIIEKMNNDIQTGEHKTGVFKGCNPSIQHD